MNQLIAGYRHSLALTNSGDLFSWGYGGNCGLLSNVLSFLNTPSPLGHGSNNNFLMPELIKAFNSPVSHAAAGKDFSLAVVDGKVYGWGAGLTFLNQNPSSVPKQMTEINYFLEKNHCNVVKMKAVGYSAFFLLDNGRIYVIGKNNGGVFATRQNPLIMNDNIHDSLAKVIDDDFKG